MKYLLAVFTAFFMSTSFAEGLLEENKVYTLSNFSACSQPKAGAQLFAEWLDKGKDAAQEVRNAYQDQRICGAVNQGTVFVQKIHKTEYLPVDDKVLRGYLFTGINMTGQPFAIVFVDSNDELKEASPKVGAKRLEQDR